MGTFWVVTILYSRVIDNYQNVVVIDEFFCILNKNR
jgi:hypothetical protein